MPVTSVCLLCRVPQLEIDVFIGSWNVNGKAPPRDVSSWLQADHESKGGQPDVYVLGFQEIVDLNASSLMIDHNAHEVRAVVCNVSCVCVCRSVCFQSTSIHTHTHAHAHAHTQAWHVVIERTLVPELYSRIMSKHLVGISTSVYVKRTLRPHIKDLRFNTCGVGILGIGECVSECVCLCV
jgi:phosphatidylinositol-bisphosphatase